MSTLTLSPPLVITARQLFTLDGVSWEQYVAVCDAFPDWPGLRFTYDGDRLELMSTSSLHEATKHILGLLINSLAFELGIPKRGLGNTTFRSAAKQRGLEPDDCYFFANAAAIQRDVQWDPEIHPPPDLAVEIDVKSRSVKRQPIYAKLGVPELWRFTGETLLAFQLNDQGEYEPIEYSLSFPFLRVADLTPFVLMQADDENEIVRAFLEWIRESGFEKGSAS